MTRLTRRTFFKRLFGGTAIASAGIAVACGYGNQAVADWLHVRRATIPIDNLPKALDGLRIVHMTDFHLHPFTQVEQVEQAIDFANQLRPDIIALTGDYVSDSAESIRELAPAVAQAQAKHGTYAVLGNHDVWTDEAVVRRGLEGAGVPVLVNEGLTLAVGDASINVAGLESGWYGTPDLNRALADAPTDADFTLALVHEPDFADDLAQDGRVSLQLSGHSHGGQIRFPWFGAPVLPRLAQKYDLGLYQVNEMWLNTSAGVGVVALPVRFNCPPEITELMLARVETG